MIKKVYLLESDLKNCSSFFENYSDDDTSIITRAVSQKWKPFDNYEPIKLELSGSDLGKKNYKFDFCSFLSPFFIISFEAYQKISCLLVGRGQILSVITRSKQKKFLGYYPTNVLERGALNLEQSEYAEYPNGLMIYTPVLKSEKITDEYLFSIEEDSSRVFVTDKFKQKVEELGLVGFDFSNEIELS